MRSILAFILLSAGWLNAHAQTTERFIFSVRKYGIAEGLPQRAITSIAQDHRGFIWLATSMGLVRFDGYTFINHTRANGLHMDPVLSALCDGDGMLWLLYPDGQADIFDPRNGRCVPLKDHFGARTPGKGLIAGMRASSNGTIAYMQDGYLVRYRSAKEGFDRFQLDCAGPNPHRVDDNGDVWCTCMNNPLKPENGELVCVGSGGGWKRGTAPPMQRIPDVIRPAHMGLDRTADAPAQEESYCVFQPSGLTWVSPDGESKGSTSTNDPAMHRPIRQGFMLLPLTEDIWLMNTTVRSMRAGEDPIAAPVLFDIATGHPEASLYVTDALRDRVGNIWISGSFGLFKLSIHPDRFERWLWDDGLTGAIGINVRGMAVVDDRLHVNSEFTGQWVVDTRTGAITDSSHSRDYGLAMIADGHGGTWRSTAWSIAHAAQGLAEDERVMFGRGHVGAWSILPLGADRLLLGTSHGLVLVDATGTRPIEHAEHAELDRAVVWHLQRDRQGQILCSTTMGLYRLGEDGSVQEHWGIEAPAVQAISHQLPTDDIRHFHEDSTGWFWLATATQGLIRWDRKSGTSRMIGVREGLPASSIHAVYPDAYGSLWLPTDNGLVRYDPVNGQVKVFTAADGITNNEFNRIAHTQGPDGRLYFGGFNGVTVVDPKAFRSATSVPTSRLVLDGVHQQEADGTRPTDRTMAALDGAPIIMRPGDRFFTVDMVLLTYDEPAQIRYAWRIDGIDEEWNRQIEPHLRFTSLPYGEHVLHITAIDADGRPSANELTIPIVVVRPIYLRWWFFAGVILLAGAAVYAAFRYRVRQLQQVIRVRDRIAMDLHDEVGSNLSGIVLFSAAVKNSAGQLPEKVADMLHRISNNSTLAMESMNDIVWSVNSKHDQLADVIDRMRAYAQPLCEAADIDLAFNVQTGLPERKLGMEERKSLYLIFKEAVNNAVKHAQCSRIDVSLRRMDPRIEMVVADNGVGVREKVTGEGTLGGNGLDNMQRRAQDVGGQLMHQPRAVGGGTEVVLRIPTGRS